MRPMAFLLPLFFAATAHAGGSQISEQSAAAAGAGGTGVTREGDPAAAWYNPAALADGEGWRAGGGVLAISPEVEARGAGGTWSATTDSRWRTPPHAYLSLAHRAWAAGVSVNVPFGSSVVWPEDWSGRHETVATRLQVVRIAPFAAHRLGTRVRVAAGVHLDVATLQLSRKLDMVDTEGDAFIDLAGTGFGAHAALHADVSDAIVLGVTAKSRTRIALRGNADFTAPDAFAGRAPDQRASSEITLPDLLSAGIAWRPHAAWTLRADVGVATWDVWDVIEVDFEDADTPDAVSRPRWRTTAWVRGGAERTLGSRAVVRAGLVADPSPAPRETLAPNAPDADRFGATLGAGVRVRGGLAVDVFYEYLHLARRETANPDTLAATYGGTAHFAGLGLRWQR